MGMFRADMTSKQKKPTGEKDSRNASGMLHSDKCLQMEQKRSKNYDSNLPKQLGLIVR